MKKKELSLMEIKEMINEPIFDSVSRCWIVVESFDELGINFTDGTFIANDDTEASRDRYYEDWVPLNEKQKEIQMILKESEAIEICAMELIDAGKITSNVLTQLKHLKEQMNTILVYATYLESKKIIDSSIIRIDSILSVSRIMYEEDMK